jgi:hypothetical protein
MNTFYRSTLSCLFYFGLATSAQAYSIVTNSDQFCNHDNVGAWPETSCAWPETSSVCPSDCGVTGISKYANQRAKYIDQTCQYNGNGLSNTCASSNGASGRFNELQAAIDSLRAGDTLYVYPGDYWREAEADTVGNYTVDSDNSGTEEMPVIITAHDVNNPPVLHSANPNGVGRTNPAIMTNYSVHHVIFDHLFINGLIQAGGHNIMIQFTEAITGYEGATRTDLDDCGDGNWSVIRLEGCTDCIVHHNYVHDVAGDGESCGNTQRGAGLKEFETNRAIWEFNTVEGAPWWGYDLHRDSLDSTVRFNQFVDSGDVGIRFGGGSSPHVYGNIVHNTNYCLQHLEYDRGVSHDEIFNNVCSYTNRNIISPRDYNIEFHNNIVSHVVGSSSQNLGVQPKNSGVTALMDHNAYDSNANYHYGADIWGWDEFETSLANWQSRFPGQELHSLEAAGGACSFADAPTSASDLTFDFTPTDPFCTTGSSEGGMLGPYGLVSCVGHSCGDVDETQLAVNSYVSLNPHMVSASVMSLADNNVITAGERTLNLGLYQLGSLYDPNERVITPGMVIKGTKPFDLGSGVSGTDTPVHASMLGSLFVMPQSRYNHTYHMISPLGDASIQITIEGTTSTHPLAQGEIFNFEAGEVNDNAGAIISSDRPILVSHTALASWGSADASPVPPAATELWGICSGGAYVSAAEDNTQVTIYSNTSSTPRVVTLNAGERRSVCTTPTWSERNQGRGPAVHIVSNNPVGAVQIADGDGGDQTAFYPTSLLNSRFGISKDSQYIAITCPSAGTTVTLYRPDGSTETRSCNANGEQPGKAFFGSHENGPHIAQGSYLESNEPIYVIYEVADSNDEHNLVGAGTM